MEYKSCIEQRGGLHPRMPVVGKVQNHGIWKLQSDAPFDARAATVHTRAATVHGRAATIDWESCKRVALDDARFFAGTEINFCFIG